MEHSGNNTVTLEIEGILVQCNRTVLTQNSDYFKAMFEGNFIESSKNIVNLNGLEIEAMNIILKLLWDNEYIIEEENLLPVLQASCMLQFLQVKETCINRIVDVLSVANCLKIWFITENLAIKEVYCKAKLLAMLEFMFIKDTGYFLELNLNQIVTYLGNVSLQCSSELIVFDSIIKWYENLKEVNQKVFLKLLHCIDFTDVVVEDVSEMLTNRIITQNETLSDILKCIISIKNTDNIEGFGEDCVKYAQCLLKSKHRNTHGFPCILVDNAGEEQDSTVFYHDKFKRKRKYNVVENNPSISYSVAYVDILNQSIRKIFHVEALKCGSLDGYRVSSYKNFVFLYGGEYLLGKGDWNWDFYIYDVIKENWRKKRIPFPRRHFQSCICGKYLFIVGGTGPFRVIQENVFFYDMDTAEWSKEVKLPCSGRQIKCCTFQNQLFILTINNKCGYIFSRETGNWTHLYICDSDNILPFYSKNMMVFSYKNSIFIKENKWVQLKIVNDKLVIVGQTFSSEAINESGSSERVFCNNIIYSLNNFSEESNDQSISSEMFNAGTTRNRQVLKLNQLFNFRAVPLVIFNVFHPHLLETNDFINELF